MTDSLPPVAIRVARPFGTEEELFENELETLTRTSITLLGAQPRPQGLVLRFELLLAGGQALVRGEGRVIGYKPDVYYGLGGLTLRFTRLDSRSKAVVDRAAELRERRRPSSAASLREPPSLAPSAPAVPAPPVRIDGAETPKESRSAAPPPPVVVPAVVTLPTAVSSARDEPSDLTSDLTSGLTSRLTSGGTSGVTFAADRDALLDRLRARSKALGGDVLRKILERGR